MVESDLKRWLVHQLIMNGGRADIETLKKKSDKVYSNAEQFEKCLEEVSTRLKDARNKVTFKLKESEYLVWFDPFFYSKPE